MPVPSSSLQHVRLHTLRHTYTAVRIKTLHRVRRGAPHGRARVSGSLRHRHEKAPQGCNSLRGRLFHSERATGFEPATLSLGS